MHHRQFAAPVHRVQLRELRVQREGVVEHQRRGGELRQRAACGSELRVADGGHGRQPVEPAAQQGLVSVDPERLSIALANLVSNAIRHTPRGGSVRLAAKRDDGLLRIQVADTGEGIDAALLPRIFDRAVTAPRSSDGSPHHGLGLTIAREIVLQHGGELLVASEPGQGSVFTLVLPLDV